MPITLHLIMCDGVGSSVACGQVGCRGESQLVNKMWERCNAGSVVLVEVR